MTKKHWLMTGCASAGLAALASLALWQFQVNGKLRGEVDRHNREFEEVKAASKRLSVLQEQQEELDRRELSLERKVPKGEKYPLGLVRELSDMATVLGFTDLNFFFEKKKEVLMEEMMRDLDGSGQDFASGNRKQKKAPGKTELTQLHLQMEMFGDFNRLAAFLKKVRELERIVKVEEIVVERKEELLPKQKIEVSMVVFSY